MGFDLEELIDLIIDYAHDHKSFDTDFIESISDSLSEYGELTSGQSAACQNIVDRYRMVKWREEKDLIASRLDSSFCKLDSSFCVKE